MPTVKSALIIISRCDSLFNLQNFAVEKSHAWSAKTLEIEQKEARTAAREKRFRLVKELHQGGMPILAIARRLKMSRNTVKKFLAVGSALQRQPNCPRFSPVQQYLPYLQKRWTQDGERSGRALWREIKA